MNRVYRRKSDWQKEVRIRMIQKDTNTTLVAEQIGIERSRVAKVINETSLAPEIAELINKCLGVKTSYPYTAMVTGAEEMENAKI